MDFMDVWVAMMTVVMVVGVLFMIGVIAVVIPMALARTMSNQRGMNILAVTIYAVITVVFLLLTAFAGALQLDWRLIIILVSPVAGCIIGGFNLAPAWEHHHSEP